MANITTGKISDLKQDPHNTNLGSERGNKLIKQSLQDSGAARSVVTADDNTLIAGNKTAQNWEELQLEEDTIVVETDGSQLVVIKRTDLKAGSKEAAELAFADNRASQVSYVPAIEEIRALSDTHEIDLTKYYTDTEAHILLAAETVDLDKFFEDHEEIPAATTHTLTLSFTTAKQKEAIKQQLHKINPNLTEAIVTLLQKQ